jgi:hypothetical protein
LFIAGAAVAAIALLAYEDGFFRAWTVLQLALIPYAWKHPRDPLTLALVASLCTTSRVFFNIVPVWYGFVFVVPLYVVCAAALLRFAPPRFVVPLLSAVAVLSLAMAHRSYARKTIPVTTARGTFYDAVADRARAIEALQRIPMRSLAVIPEGLALNYLLRVPAAMRYHTFTPPESADPAMEERIIAEFEAKQPETVVILPRPLEEFGAKRFGVDYDQRLALYLRTRYGTRAVVGGPEYRMYVLRRRER